MIKIVAKTYRVISLVIILSSKAKNKATKDTEVLAY